MGRKINLENLFIVVIFVLLACIFYYPIFLGKVPFNGNLLVAFWSPWKYQDWVSFPTGIPFKFMGVDEIREFFPVLDFTDSTFATGAIPLWNPYNFSGYPHLANWASAVFYPLHVALLLLDKITALIYLKLTSIILSGFFTYLYLRVLKLDSWSSLLGGLAFAFSATLLIWGSEIWQAVHAVTWLPLALFGIEKVRERRSLGYLIVSSAALACSILAGYIQPTIYVYLFTLAYGLFRMGIGVSQIVTLGAIFLTSFAFSAVQIVPGLEFFRLSPRSEVSLIDLNVSFLLPLSRFITVFVPDFFGHVATQNWFSQRPGQYYEQMVYIGVIPLVFASFAFFVREQRRLVLFFFIGMLLSLTAIFNLPTSRLVYNLGIPFLSSAIPIRIIFITAFCLSILSAFGCSFWLENKDKDKKRFLLSLFPLAFVYSAIAVFLFISWRGKVVINGFPTDWFIISGRNFVIPAFVFLVSSALVLLGVFFSKLKRCAYILVLFLFIFHSFVFAHKYFVFSERRFFYPSHLLLSYLKEHMGLSRYFGYGEASLANNFATVFQLYSPDGYDPVNIKQYNELLSSASSATLKGVASRSDALIPNADISPTEDRNIPRLRLLDLLGIKYVGYYDPNHKPTKKDESNDRFLPVWEDNGFMIFQNKKAFERAFLVAEAAIADSKEEAIRMLYDPSIDLTKTVILRESITLPRNDSLVSGSAKITLYTHNKVIIRTSSSTSQLLVLSDSYYPGWEVMVNGTRGKIYEANYALRAVLIPKGESEVVFSYQPKSFRIGIIGSIGSISLAGFILLLRRRRWI